MFHQHSAKDFLESAQSSSHMNVKLNDDQLTQVYSMIKELSKKGIDVNEDVMVFVFDCVTGHTNPEEIGEMIQKRREDLDKIMNVAKVCSTMFNKYPGAEGLINTRNKSHLANQLGVSRVTLDNWMK